MQSESRIGYPGAGSVSSMAAQSMQLQQPQQHNHHTQQQHQQQQQRQHFELQVPRTVFAGQYPQANDNVQLQSDAYYASHSPQHQQIAFQPHEPLTCQTTAQQQQTTTSVYHHLRQRSSQQQQQQQQQLSYSSDPSYLRAQATSQNLARKQHPFHNQDQLTIDHNNNHKHLIQGNSTLTLDCSHENINPNFKQHHITRYVGQKHQDPQEQHQHYQEGSVVVGYNGDYVHSNQQQQTIAGGCSPGAGSPMASSPMASSPDMVISHQQAQEQQFFTNEIADQFSHHQSQMAHQAQAVVFQPTTRALMSHASETNTTTTTMTTTTTTNGHLAQLRPRVNSISTAMRREPTPTTVYSPKLQPVGAITRSLSFSATVGPDQDGQQQLASSSSCMRVRPRPAVSTLDAEVFRRTEQRTQAAVAAGHHQGDDQTQIHLARSGGSSVHYYDAPQSLAPPGSMSSACSSIGSPVPLALSGGSCSDAISPPIGTGHHQARSISSNSSTDGAASIYGQQQQQQLYAGNSYHNQQQQQQQQQQASSGSGSGNSTTTTAGSSCGSSIISTSDSVSMSINLEQYISKRNERERSRVRNVNDAFDNLKNSLPLDVEKMSKRMSKVEILRTAISYIRNLEQVLGYKPQFDDPNSKAPPPSSSSASSLHHHSEHHISYSPTSAAAATANNNKRLNFSRGYRRLDAAHHAYQQQHHHHNRHHHHHHHHNQKHYRSSEERAHGRHYESNGGGSMMARRNGSLSPNEKMITRDDDGEYHAGSGSLTSAGDFDGSRLDEFDGQQLAESDQEQADGSAGTGGDSRGSCMDHHFEGY